MRISSLLKNCDTKHDKSGLTHVINEMASRFQELGSKVSADFSSKTTISAHRMCFRQGAALHLKTHRQLHQQTAEGTKQRSMWQKLKNL